MAARIDHVPLETLAELLSCPICLEHLSRCVETPCCTTCFCEPCLSQALTRNKTCPTCRRPLIMSATRYNKPLQRLVGALPLACEFCSEWWTRGSIADHALKCSLNPNRITLKESSVVSLKDTSETTPRPSGRKEYKIKRSGFQPSPPIAIAHTEAPTPPPRSNEPVINDDRFPSLPALPLFSLPPPSPPIFPPDNVPTFAVDLSSPQPSSRACRTRRGRSRGPPVSRSSDHQATSLIPPSPSPSPSLLGPIQPSSAPSFSLDASLAFANPFASNT
eukprot:GILK01009502.1.p1 GENE.GILK01009502.1~~GILK01009502.1.p1  ORF type:complete len:285 (+),score=8.09 GILK01009502.1:29-856(+)